jgi:predicted nucleic-acid-binding Zn-ribbon protein
VLSMRQASRLREWMNQRGINRCVACGAQDDWNFSGGEVFVPARTSDERLSERFQPSLPRGLKVTLPCANCGYVMFFDARTVGVERF